MQGFGSFDGLRGIPTHAGHTTAAQLQKREPERFGLPVPFCRVGGKLRHARLIAGPLRDNASWHAAVEGRPRVWTRAEPEVMKGEESDALPQVWNRSGGG